MKNYSRKWIIQHITAVLLIPLSFWFIYNCVSFASMNYSELILFFNSTLNSFLFLVMMITMLIHAKFGCENIIEDYVSSVNIKNISKLTINALTFLSIFIVIIAISKILLI